LFRSNLESITATQVGIHFSVSGSGIGISEIAAIEKRFRHVRMLGRFAQSGSWLQPLA